MPPQPPSASCRAMIHSAAAAHREPPQRPHRPPLVAVQHRVEPLKKPAGSSPAPRLPAAGRAGAQLVDAEGERRAAAAAR